MQRYPRDMSGHGPNPPDPQWPGGARIAVQIVVNYEEGGENNILHGDAASEAFLSEIVGAAAWPGQRHWNMESIYEYGARAGFWRLHRMLRALPVTVYGVATALARAPEQVAAMQQAGWEIASHGLKWIEYKDAAPKDEARDMAEAIRLHTEVTGTPPRGWYTGRCSDNTVRLAAETGSFAYVADSYADDLPYWSEFGDRDQLIVPYTLDANDMRFATPQGFNSGAQFETYLRDSFDCLYAEGEAGAPKMMSPWIAERAHALELSPAHDSAAGVHSALARMFRSASVQERLGVLTAHPDLAGKLAQARRLTAESTSEQAAAGLDALTDAERDTFQELNAAYVEKHGFPFIIAVRDHDKQGILAAFERRLANDRETEFAEAARQVERIAALRLSDMLP